MSLRTSRFCIVWAAAAWWAWSSLAGAQPDDSHAPLPQDKGTPGASAPPTPSDPADADAGPAEVSLLEPMNKAALTERLERVAGLGLDEDEQQAATENYTQALKWRNMWATLRDQTKAWAKALDERPSAIERKKQREAKLATEPSVAAVPTTLPELEAYVPRLDQQVQQLQSERDHASTEIKTRTARLSEIPRQITDTQNELRKVEEQLAAQAGTTPASDEVAVSALIALVNRRQALDAKVANLQQEQLLHADSELDLLQLTVDVASTELNALQQQLTRARAERNRLQQAEADREAREAAEEAAVDRPEAIDAIADRNAELTADRQRLISESNVLKEQLQQLRQQRDTLQKQFASTTARVDASGLSVSAGQLLLRQQKELPQTRRLRRQAAARIATNDDLQFTLYELQDQREALADVEPRIRQVLAAERYAEESEVRELLENQRSYLDRLVESYQAYSNDLTTLAAEEESLAALADEYGEYIAQRVLWIRSSPALGASDLRPAAGGVAWSLDPHNWRDAGLAIWASFLQRPATSAVFVAIIVVLLSLQQIARRRIREFGAIAEKRTCADFTPTLQALAYTLMAALPWPALIWFLGWSMDNPTTTSDFVRSLSGATRTVAKCFLLLEVIRVLCRHDGLADSHFQWPQACLLQLRRHVRWLTLAGTPLLLWSAGLELQETEPLYNTSVGRVCFIVLMLLVASRLQVMLLGRSSPFRQLLKSDGWLAPLQYLWRPALVLLPVALAILAGVGYYFSAQHAAGRLVESMVLVLVVLVIGGLTWRWLLTNRRSLAREQAKQRRAQLAAAAAAAANAEDGAATAPEVRLPALEAADEAVDLAALSEQTQKMVRAILAAMLLVGMFFIWNELLPAVAYLGDANVLPGFTLTWGQLLKFAIISVVTYVAVRDIPALLELLVLQRLPLDSGSRYALTTVSRYLLGALGISAAYTALGYTSANLQWLVAAMGVGLGFGLQEIFANFVSGIILLFERPIRVGDIVTLGDKTGAVTRIRMRATTIVDWDRKEYIVPNKDLVTERLLNWTLSDQTNRVVVNVGVAYGADTDLACQLLLEAAKEQPAILDDPQPLATFEGFGDSSLNLILRCYLPNLDNRLATIHALHSLIDQKFRVAGIEIPFPQRDLNLRDVPQGWLDAATHGNSPGAASEPTNGATPTGAKSPSKTPEGA